jgi:hypothetical protein
MVKLPEGVPIARERRQRLSGCDKRIKGGVLLSTPPLIRFEFCLITSSYSRR